MLTTQDPSRTAGIKMRLSDAAHCLAGRWVGADVEFHGAVNDTRKLPAGALYVALPGERFDGHDFVSTARTAGAVAALVGRVVDDPLPQIVVDDPRLALGRLAAAWRGRFSGPLVAITGSNGKTTVKEMVRAILAQNGPTLATIGNLNNDIGAPLTLLRLEPGFHHAAVVEVGANHPGEIAFIAGLACPTVAVVNNAGPAHLEGFGSVAGVAQAKGEIYGALSTDGVAVINADDPHASLWRKLAKGRNLLDFGLTQPAAVSAQIVEVLGAAGGTRIRLYTPVGATELTVPLPGRHNVMNALAATAVALGAGVSLTAVIAGLAVVDGVAGRLRPCPGRNGTQIIDDTYNANPASLRAALEVLATFPGERCLVLGDMAELGPGAVVLHAEVGDLARNLGIEILFGCGSLSREAVSVFGPGAGHYADVGTLVTALEEKLRPGLTVLVKGSRSAGMERVVRLLAAG
ncbi:D-alanyl-D-alanine-adding enzyme [Gammaproteobacteria bacterium]